MAGFHFFGILAILIVATLNFNFANGSPQNQRNRLTSRLQTIRSSTTTEASSSTSTVSNRRRGGGPTSTSHATDGPVSRLRPTRTTTTPIPPTSEVTSSKTTQNDPNDAEQASETNSNRKELIEKLCNRKYGHTPQSGPEQVPKRGTDIGTASEDEAMAAFQSQQTQNQRLRGRPRPRRALRRISRPTTTSTTTQSPETIRSSQPQFVCHDFDNLTIDQLMNRVKNGRRRKNPKIQQNIVS